MSQDGKIDQKQADQGVTRFFDLFVAMCNHIDDIVDMYVRHGNTFKDLTLTL